MDIESASTIWILLGTATGAVANAKGRSFWLWAAYGWFLNPIALFHAIVLKAKIKCPMCAEIVNPDALFCRFCGFLPDTIIEASALCPSCGALKPIDANRCAWCGYGCAEILGAGPKEPAPRGRRGATIEVVPSEPKAVVVLARLCSFCGGPARGGVFEGHPICAKCSAATEPTSPNRKEQEREPDEPDYVRGFLLLITLVLAIMGIINVVSRL